MRKRMQRRDFLKGLGAVASCLAAPGLLPAAVEKPRPNIVWIVAEDTSAHLGCYGETTIKTPNLDSMAKESVLFDAAFVTCPVCSPCRSAMVTGMYQTTLGAHNHRSQGDSGKAGGNKNYYDSYKLPVKLIPEVFRDAGYYVTLGSGPSCKSFGKTDYNFIWLESAYDGANWREAPKDKPFFAQIMLKGGKNRSAKEHATDPATVKLPPYYPDHPVLCEDWANYLNSWVQIDVEVGEILDNLKKAGVLENTLVFFWTDHGISHLRGKQFLYEEGIRVPMIVRLPGKENAGQVRIDLVMQIDAAATSLARADIPIPENVQGRDIFAEDYTPRKAIFAARDRCDETVEVIRCVRTDRYKYIRNFLSYLPHAQPNQYKDGKKIIQILRQLHKEGKLSELQARPFAPTRPPEELYDLEKDPYETVNLAGKPEHERKLKEMRRRLMRIMSRTRDLGLIPEPIIEDMGKKYGNKYFVLEKHNNPDLLKEIVAIIAAGEQGNAKKLRKALAAGEPAVRYWASTWLGNLGHTAAAERLSSIATDDPSAGVRIAAALALCKLGEKKFAQVLIDEIDNENVIAGMYAIRAIEFSGVDTPAVRAAVEKARKSPYEFTRRIANRLSAGFKG